MGECEGERRGGALGQITDLRFPTTAYLGLTGPIPGETDEPDESGIFRKLIS